MNNFQPNYIEVPSLLKILIGEICSYNKLTGLEELVTTNKIEKLSIFNDENWLLFRDKVNQIYSKHNFAVIKGFGADHDGASLLFAALTIGESLRCYRGNKVIKHFKMSPWTRELAHTLKAGEFHTDLNTEKKPPEITAIQCLEPDPGSPNFGILYVANLSELIHEIKQNQNHKILLFLTDEIVTMLSERSSSSWTGNLVEDNMIRYHPETLRAANRMLGKTTHDLEQIIEEIESSALAVSVPIALNSGDLVLISNRRSLHRRGESSVLFEKYPTDFQSRRIAILHASNQRKIS